MSDRAIPRSFRFMEGFGVHTFRLVNARGKSTFVKFHWKPKLGTAIGLVERSRQDQRRRSGLSPARPLERHSIRQLSRMGIVRSTLRRHLRREVPLRRPGRNEVDSRRGRPAAKGRPVGAGPLRRQLLRRNGTSRVLHAEHRPGRRLHRRPASARAELFISRHAAQTARQSELHVSAGQRAEVPLSNISTRRSYGVRQSQRTRELRTKFVERSRRRSSRNAGARLSEPTPRK